MAVASWLVGSSANSTTHTSEEEGVGPHGPTPIVVDNRDERCTDTLLVRVLCVFV